MVPFSELVTIGRAIKPQGRHGEIAVEVISDRPDRFESLTRVFVPGPQGAAREVAVERVWPHKGRMIVKLAGVDSIDVAESYRGMDLRIAEDELEALPPGSYYHHQLKGLAVVAEDGSGIGTIEDLLETGAAMVLVVRGPNGETLIPLADEYVRNVDLAAHKMLVHLPETVDAGR